MSTSSTPSTSSPSYSLYYWPSLPGRGEFARLLLEETATPYDEPFASLPYPQLLPQLAALKTQHSFFALPLLAVHNPAPSPSSTLPAPPSSLHVSGSGVICRYLAHHLDGGRLAPRTEADDYRAQQLIAMAVDAVGEGCHAWHAIDTNASYDSQKKETQPFIDQFVSRRLPRWLEAFEKALEANGGKHLVGEGLTYVDIFVFQWLHGVEYQCPKEYAALPIPLLRALKDAVQQRPAIAKRVANRKQYDGTGPCF